MGSRQGLLSLVGKLALMRGQGSVAADDWIAAFGDDLMEVLADAPDPVAAVREWVQRNDWRPSVAELARMVDEQRQARGQGQAETREQGCPDCVGGYRTARSLRRMPSGQIVAREAATPCSCARGQSIARGLVASSNGLRGPRTWREVATDLQAEQVVSRASGQPGLLGFDITDRHWTGWSVELYPDPAAQQALRDRAARRGRQLTQALVREQSRQRPVPREAAMTWHDEPADATEDGVW